MTAEITRSIAATPSRATASLASQGGAAVQRTAGAEKSSSAVQPPQKAEIHFDANEIRQDLKEAIDLLNNQVSKHNLGLGFVMDEALGRPVVTVRNTESGEVVRQIPNEVVVKVAHNIEAFKGLLHNGTA